MRLGFPFVVFDGSNHADIVSAMGFEPGDAVIDRSTADLPPLVVKREHLDQIPRARATEPGFPT